jgi:general secretion pathway protein I
MTKKTGADASVPRVGRAGCRVRGFTLIEVLAALVIVALGMLGVIEAVSQTARNGTYLRDKTLAHWVAMNIITERRLEPDPPRVAQTSDEVELAGQKWHWTLDVSETAVESMRRLDIKVRAADAPENSSLASLTGYYGSAISPSSGVALPWRGSNSRGPDDNENADDADDRNAGDSTEPAQPVEPDSEESVTQ